MSEIQAILTENEKLSREMLRANADSIDQSLRFPHVPGVDVKARLQFGMGVSYGSE
jgi:hypothetical protein